MNERAKNFLTLAISTLLSFLALEAASRILVARRTPPGMRFEGPILYTYAPRTRIQGMVLNDVGCVGDDAVADRTVDAGAETRVLLLGGSTSFSARYVLSVKAALQAKHPARFFRVMSCGRPRYTSWVNRVNFERNAAIWSPDVVVYYEGINDNIYNSFPWLDGAPTVGYFDAKSLGSSVFLDLLRYHVIDKALRSVPDFESRPLRSPAIFEENLRGIVAIARRRNASAVLATFAIALPTSDGRLLARIRAEEAVMRHFWGNPSSTAAGVRAHDQVVERLATQLNLPLARVAEAVPHDSAHFGDICHLTDAGNEVLGRVIASAVPVRE
ncbi:MAG TPA: hypothetical protein VLJ18_03850 [Thermoanaerobaculia bacterium]|nr:hypothetical protein [Thermoanaerobaculia bacterium]